MLVLIEQTLNLLAQEQISFCSWKNNHELKSALAGESDLDLLVASEQEQELRVVLRQLGYREAFNRYISYPYIGHFYGLDVETGTIAHLHVYLQLVTGESHTKNYRFPYEAEILSSVVSGPYGVPIPSRDWQESLFVLRHFIKVSSLPGLLLFLREKDSYIREYEDIAATNGISNPVGDRILGGAEFAKLTALLDLRSVNLTQILLGLRLRRRVRHRRRMSGPRVFLQRYQQIAYRALNKLLFKQRKRLVGGGVLVGVTGLDGTGKSSLVHGLTTWLGGPLDARAIHLGRPRSAAVTLPVNLILALWRGLRRSRNGGYQQTSGGESGDSSFPAAVRYLALGIDRHRAVAKARRLSDRGFVVVADRYPSLSRGKMDSPRLVASENSTGLLRRIAAREADLYRRMGRADLLIWLDVSVETAVERNRSRIKAGKESDTEIRQRHEYNRNLDFGDASAVEVDAEGTFEDTMHRVKNLIWDAL